MIVVVIVIIEILVNGQDLIEIVNNSNDKSDSNLSDYKTNSNRDIIPILSEDIIDSIIVELSNTLIRELFRVY